LRTCSNSILLEVSLKYLAVRRPRDNADGDERPELRRRMLP
jgi:hypothetical protein